MLTVRTLAPLITAAALILAAPAQAAQTPDQIMRHLAANQTHSWVHDDIGYTAMFAKYRAGERLYVTCGHVAEVGRQLLSAAGYKSRVVQVITKDPFDYVNDGHLMTEVFYGGKWQLYDLDSNARGVDENGNGRSLVEQVAAVREERAMWETIATDPLWNENESNPESLAIARDVFSDPARFYRRVMGVPLLPKDPYGQIGYGTYFWDASQIDRLRAYTGGASRTLASDATWQQLNAPPVPVLVEYAAAKPPSSTSVAVQTATTSRATPAAPVTARPRCQQLKRRYQRTHTRRAHVRYKRCLRRATAA